MPDPKQILMVVRLTPIELHLLSVLIDGEKTKSIQDVLETLIDHAQQGVYRPGSWERDWLCVTFGDDWLSKLQPGDPYGRPDCESIFQKPKTKPPTNL